MTRPHSYKGVYKCGNRFRAQIQTVGVQYYLGVFDTDVEAARAYDSHALSVLGKRAKLNFPDSISETESEVRSNPRMSCGDNHPTNSRTYSGAHKQQKRSKRLRSTKSTSSMESAAESRSDDSCTTMEDLTSLFSAEKIDDNSPDDLLCGSTDPFDSLFDPNKLCKPNTSTVTERSDSAATESVHFAGVLSYDYVACRYTWIGTWLTSPGSMSSQPEVAQFIKSVNFFEFRTDYVPPEAALRKDLAYRNDQGKWCGLLRFVDTTFRGYISDRSMGVVPHQDKCFNVVVAGISNGEGKTSKYVIKSPTEGGSDGCASRDSKGNYSLSGRMNVLGETVVEVVSNHTAEAAHCGEHEPILFGAYAVYYFTTGEFFVMVLVVIGFVLLVEFLFHVFHFLTHESPFDKMIIAVEKELMTVGFTAFIFKIIINSTHVLKSEWLHAFELADLMVPVFSFCNCFLGLILVFLSIRQCNKWSTASMCDLSELLDHFYHQERRWFDGRVFPFFNADIGKMEFRIFHNIFCEMYSLKRDAFAFDEYVNNVFENFIYNIVKIRPINWLCLCLLLYLDYARTSNELYVFGCEREDVHCVENSSIMSFAIVGTIIFGIMIIFWIVSRYYESRIIIEKGIYGYDYYPIYLQFMEDEYLMQGDRLNEAELKEAATDMRRAYLSHQHHKHKSLLHVTKDTSSQEALTRQLEKRHSTGDFVEQVDTEEVMQLMKERLKSKSSFLLTPNTSGKSPSPAVNTNDINNNGSFKLDLVELSEKVSLSSLESSGDAKNKGSSSESLHIKAVHSLNSVTEDHSLEPPMEHATARGYKLTKRDSDMQLVNNYEIQLKKSSKESMSMMMQPSAAQDSAMHQSITRVAIEDPNEEVGFGMHCRSSSTQLTADNNAVLGSFKAAQQKKHEHIQELFLFGSPTFYFECVKLLVMFISLNIAFWLIYFIGSPETSHKWKFLSIAPPLLSFVLYLDVVKTASLLKAVVSLDTAAVVEVIELSEEAQRLEAEVRKEIVDSLFLRKDLQGLSLEEKLRTVYRNIDKDDDGHMTRKEFTSFLSHLEIYPSRKALRQIFRKMDRNVDNDISLSEFTLFIMPQNKKAQKVEEDRLEQIRTRVTNRTIELTEEMAVRAQHPTLWDRLIGRNYYVNRQHNNNKAERSVSLHRLGASSGGGSAKYSSV